MEVDRACDEYCPQITLDTMSWLPCNREPMQSHLLASQTEAWHFQEAVKMSKLNNIYPSLFMPWTLAFVALDLFKVGATSLVYYAPETMNMLV